MMPLTGVPNITRPAAWAAGAVVLFWAGLACAADYPPAHHGNQPVALADGDRIFGVHTGISTFTIPAGATVRVVPYDGVDDSRGTLHLPAALSDGVVMGGRLLVTPTIFQPESSVDFTTNVLQPEGSSDGWSNFGFSTPSLGWADHDTTAGALRAHVTADANRYRMSGVRSNTGASLPYSAVGQGNIVRAKFMIFAGGQDNPDNQNEIPNVRMRLANRFAASSMLEVYSHVNGDPESTVFGHDIAPSRDPAKPSVYRVDFDPVDVPYLGANADETIMQAFEAYSVDPQDNGYVALTESVVGTYPAAMTAPSGPPAKTYATTGSDAGDLAAVNAAVERMLYNNIASPETGGFGTIDYNGPIPECHESAAGVTIDCTAVPDDRMGIAIVNLNPDRGTDDFANRVRVEPGRQYTVRFHLTATQQSNRQPQIRMRVRSAKWVWSQKFEIGGAWGAGAANNAIAREVLPGLGCANPDRTGDENGGWYTVMFHTPLSADIRPDVAGALADKMPNLHAQPGPGADVPSRRDLLVGIDMIDSLVANGLQHLEQGLVTVDRVEVRVHDLVPD